jgi:hypothetical protein
METQPPMTARFVCVRCDGDKCPYCGGRGWLTEETVRHQRTKELVEAVAKNLIEKRIAVIGPEEWARRASEENLTVDQYTEVEVWQATGPMKYQFMRLTEDVIDAIADLTAIEVPPVFVPDRPELNIIG